MKKKTITLEQLKRDGIAQLKTKRQLINQGILTENFNDLYLNNKDKDKFWIGGTANRCFGKCAEVLETITDEFYGDLVQLRAKNGIVWFYPISVVAK